MGTPNLTPTNNEGRAHRQSKSRRRMNGFDVRKVPVMGVGGRDQFGSVTTPRAIGRASPTHFSDMLDILQNGQRQGVLVFRSGSGLAISSPRPPVTPITSATDRAFFDMSFSDPVPSPFPFDRKVHQRQGSLGFQPATPSSPTLSNTFFPSQTSIPFTGGGGGAGALNPVTPPNSLQPTSFANLRFPEEQTTINQLINNMGFQSGAAPQPEQLAIHVVEQQNLGKQNFVTQPQQQSAGKLRTSNGLVQQQRLQKPKSKKKYYLAILHFLDY